MRRVAAGLGMLVLLAWACGGGTPFKEGGKAESELKGRVIKAPVALANVVAYRASETLERGEVLAKVKADEAGDFTLPLPHYQGNVLVVASGGTYVEESIGLGVQLGENELVLLLPDFTTGTKLEGLRVTPVSTMAVALARFHVARGKAAGEAYAEALVHLHQHFGGVDWSTVTPADLTVAGVTNLSPESRAGLVLAGLSWLAKQQAEASDVSPGLVVNAATLSSALAQDAADGTFDGLAGTTPLKQAKVALSGLTLRAEFVQAMTGFINSSRNASSLKLQDVTGFLAAIGTNNDPYLFCPGQVAAASCGSGPVDTEPPTLSFIRPSSGAGVAGSTQVEVQAADNTKLRSLKFTAPASLVSAVPVFSSESRQAVLTATLDVSAMADGPVEIRAEATDESGNPAAKSVTITVSNQGPRITIMTPGDGVTVRGASVMLTASAQAQAPGASIARIELVSPPQGMGPDSLPAADAFSAAWNTTLVPEGLTPLTVRAVDSFGTSTEVSISVIVDNVALGQVTAMVSAGAPVDGLTVKLVAIDDVTGLPVTGRAGGAVLGQSTAVTADGGVTFELQQENWTGPVQLVAEGPSVTYVDPSDGMTLITLPATFAFSTYVDSYRTGDRLERPLTYWTTLADVAARAYALGRNPTQPTPMALSLAMQTTDPLFARHITSSPWSSRQAVPARLTTGAQGLRDVVFAAFPDVSLNQEARDVATDVGLTPGSGFAAPQLVAMLLQDLADGQFDGKANGVQLQTAGTTPYLLDANTTRFRQAIALDRFVRGAQNRTGLTRQDLQTSRVYDTISDDVSLLYAAGTQPIPFDNAAPAVVWTVTYEKDAATVVAPVGTAKLVHGLVHLDLAASDMSQVSSLTVTANGTMVAAAQGSTAAHFVGSFDVSPAALTDGPLAFSAEACDRLANCGTTTYVVTVDKTPPVIAPLEPPAGAFFSTTFDVVATASDANGVASLYANALTQRLTDVDTTPERVFVAAADWSHPWVAGNRSLTFTACDVVGNCSMMARPFVLDQLPPRPLITSAVPQYTNATTLTLSGTVSDLAANSAAEGAITGAGVKRVLAQVSGAPSPVVATLVIGRTDSTWTATVTLAQGVNTIRVWAEDLSTPSNVGPPASIYSAVVTVTRDVTPLAVQTRSVASYRDERNLGVAKDAQGRPVMPVSYVYAGAPVAVDENGTVFKIKAKSGATDNNVPFLRWAVVNPGASDSPVASASYIVTMVNGIACAGGSCPSGSLRASAATEAGYTLLELPLHAGTLLPSWAQGGSVRVGVNFFDAAGNQTNRSFNIQYIFVGAPVVAVLDTNFGTYGDSSSIFPYSTNVNYPALIGSSKRVLRYVVYNPNQEVVWTSLAHTAFGGSWVERWNEGDGYGTGGGGTVSDLGQSQGDYADWYSRIYNANWEGTDAECSAPATGVDRRGAFPCARSTVSSPAFWFDPRPVHYFGEAAPFTRCEPPHTGKTGSNVGGSAFPSLTNTLSMTPGLSVMANPLPTGKEPGLATSVTFNGYVGWSVPAATLATAGAVAVYVTVATPARATTGIAAQVFPLSGAAQQRFRAGWHFTWTNTNTSLACHVCRGLGCLTYSADYYNQGWAAEYFDRFLMDHTVALSGALVVKTNPDFVDATAASFSNWPDVPYSFNATR